MSSLDCELTCCTCPGWDEFEKYRVTNLCMVILLLILYICIISYSEGEKLESKMKKLEQQYAPFQVVSLISKLGTKEVSTHDCDSV